MKRPLSLSSILLINLLLALFVYIIVISVLTFWTANNSVWQMHDYDLVTDANALLFISEDEMRENAAGSINLDITSQHLHGDEQSTFNENSAWKSFRIWHEGKLAMRTDNAMPASIPQSKQGFSDIQYQGNTWRVYSLDVPEEHITVEVAEQFEARNALVWNFAKGMVWPFLLSLPLAALIFWQAVHRGITSLRRVASQVHLRSPERMTPLETESLPPDLLPLVDAINTLLARLDASLTRERHLTDHAAHELRSPLTAIKLQAQMALRAASEAERQAALQTLLKGVDRSSYIVEQLVTLTRVEQSKFAMHAVDVTSVTRQVVTDLRYMAEKKRLEISAQLPQTLTVTANSDLLYVTLSNIISNAIKYSPEQKTLAIGATRQNDHVILSVTDQGPGIPEELREKVFERFYRHDRKETGSGLGLTIVRQCLEQMRANITFNTPPGGQGLRVEISLAAAS